MKPDQVVDKIESLARDQVTRLSEQVASGGTGAMRWSSKNVVVPLENGHRAEIEVKVRLLTTEIVGSSRLTDEIVEEICSRHSESLSYLRDEPSGAA